MHHLIPCRPLNIPGSPWLHQVAHPLLHQATGPSCQTDHVSLLCQVGCGSTAFKFQLWPLQTLWYLICVVSGRVGIMGNPSDGFNGKTIAMSISNFWAEVTLVESQTLVSAHTFTHTNVFFFLCDKVTCLWQILVPHPLNDPTEFGSLQDLFCISRKEGCVSALSASRIS